MPFYHFDIADAYLPIPCEGLELGSLGAARAQALEYAGQILRDQKPSFWNHGEWTMTVSDHAHVSLFCINVTAHDAPSTADAILGR